jgi:hypothetical protein
MPSESKHDDYEESKGGESKQDDTSRKQELIDKVHNFVVAVCANLREMGNQCLIQLR